MTLTRPLIALLALAALGGCAKDHDLSQSGGMALKRTNCPAVAVPVNTGDVTLFNPFNSRDSRAIDVVANITNVKVTCVDGVTGDIVSKAAFDVQARRTDATGARDVVLPYFSIVMQGGKIIVAKQVSTIGLHFADGQLRASTAATAAAYVDRESATLTPDVMKKINKKRISGQLDAALDPMADPDVRDQISRTNFELLIGFQLSGDQLKYNATR